MQVRTIGRLLRQEMIDAPRDRLETPDPSPRHPAGLAKGSNGMSPEIIKSIRHVNSTPARIFGSSGLGCLWGRLGERNLPASLALNRRSGRTWMVPPADR